MECQTMSVVAAGKILGLGRSAAYAAARRKQLPVIEIGGRKLVSKPALEDMLRNAGKPAGSQVAN